MADSKQTITKEKVKTVICQYKATTPCHFTHNNHDYHLYEGESYTLPVCDFVQSLIGQNHLEIIPQGSK